jgi:serine/threonine protein phosphatase PrpC
MISPVTATLQTADPVLALQGCMVQHPGDRSEQQDRVAILRGRCAPRAVLALVADGLGGRSGGALAAEQVMSTARGLFDEFSPGAPIERFFEDLVREVHIVLQLAAATVSLQPHSTLAAVLVQPERIDWCLVGDSRIYHVRDAGLASRTTDDTVLEQLIATGRLDPARARLHPSASLLTQALGGPTDPYPNLGSLHDPRAGDAFLLCSDGAWAYLPDTEIAAALSSGTLREAASTLLSDARERARGNGDNCSMVLLRLDAAR